MPEHVGLSGVEGFLEDHRFIDVQPQRPLVLVRNRGEGFPGGVIEDVVLETVDDVLAGRLRLDLVPKWREASLPYVQEVLNRE